MMPLRNAGYALAFVMLMAFFATPIQAAVTIVTPSPLPGGTINTSYSLTLSAAGCTLPCTWSTLSGSVPPGLSLNAGTGVISGTPTIPGSENFAIQLTDSANPVRTAAQSLSINFVAALVVSTPSLQGGISSQAYSQTLTATGGTSPYDWTVITGSLPPGLSLNASSGVLSGSPTTPGLYNFTVRVADSAASSPATKDLSISIDPPSANFTIAITNLATLPGGIPGVEYAHSLNAIGGVLPYNWSIASGTLPSGLSLSPAVILSGTPSVSGTFSFVQTAGGITIRTTGYAVTRSITGVSFNFEVTSASGTQAVNLARNVDGDFTGW